MPSPRRRAAAALAVGLAGVLVAVVLLRQQPDDVVTLEQANAATEAPAQKLVLAPPPRTAEDARRAAAKREPLAAAEGTKATAPSGDVSASSNHDVEERESAAATDRATTEGAPVDAPPEAKRPTGSVDRQAIKDAMTRMKPLIRACYEQGLKHDPSLAGRVVVEFEISGEEGKGVVKQGSVVESEAASPFFEACVLQKVSGLDAPAPEGGGVVKVRYPFLFDPGGGFGGEPPASNDNETP